MREGSFKLNPKEIEEESFSIINAFLKRAGFYRKFGKGSVEVSILARVIHATGDFSIANDLLFSENFFENFINALRISQGLFIADVKMVAVGISRRILPKISVLTYIDEKEVLSESKRKNVSRAYLSIDMALKKHDRAIYVVGNSPTALFRILEERDPKKTPFVVGVPVGFVGASDVKNALSCSEIPCVTLLGSRGGSSIAVAIANALLMEAKNKCNGI